MFGLKLHDANLLQNPGRLYQVYLPSEVDARMVELLSACKAVWAWTNNAVCSECDGLPDKIYGQLDSAIKHAEEGV